MSRWRVFCDANVFISYLIRPTGNGTIPQVVRFCFSEDCQLVISSELLDEIRTKTTTKPNLLKQIEPQAVVRLIEALLEIGELVTAEPSETPPELRDIKDTYLLQVSRSGDVDFLVTGDWDLRSIRDQMLRPFIVSPAELLAVLEFTYNT